MNITLQVNFWRLCSRASIEHNKSIHVLFRNNLPFYDWAEMFSKIILYINLSLIWLQLINIAGCSESPPESIFFFQNRQRQTCVLSECSCLLAIRAYSSSNSSSWRRHQMEIFPRCWPFVGEFTGNRWIPHTKASDTGLWCFLWSAL